ncbi:anaphase promoting complex subunit [Saccharomycopsis crataegensis]|uniref:Anaphase promoting complex subunit n=1 Tax=Saccharomycopsis crataegensis TaxID=43959 RepID=A0AAV5QR12_9ASCO|nr:anaphase promoting complex subunit [Saccharomycopsis crataegensis]
MNVQSYVIQRLRSTIWYSLDNSLLENAEFTAERLVGVTSKGDSESIYLYGLVLYRRGKYKTAFRVTANHIHAGCAYIFARCALKLELQKDGIEALQQTIHLWNSTNDSEEDYDLKQQTFENYETVRKSTPDAAVVFSLLGRLYGSIGDTKESAIYHSQALRLNPYLWDSFEQLCQIGANVNTKSIYKPRPILSGGYASMTNKSKAGNPGLAPMNPKAFFSKPNSFNKSEDSSFNNSNFSNNDPLKDLNNGGLNSNVTNIFSTPRLKHSSLPDAPVRKHVRGGHTEITDSIQRLGTRFTSSKVTSRLITQSTPSGSANNTVTFGKRDNKRNTKVQSSNTTPSNPTGTKLGTSNILGKNNSLDLRKQEYSDQAEFQLMTLYSILSKGLKAMSRYDCYKAIRIFDQLPDSQIETPWVLGKLGRLNFEIVNYEQAELYFTRLRKLDRTRVEDMEFYSTLLWHLQKDVELGYLAHEMYEINKTCPQTWVTIGNLFSLQRENDEAIKCFQRATQVDNKFVYAYTLQGHEYVSNDAFENALESFRNALLYDPKHYNALYGIGMVYLKLGEYQKAEYHFRKASDINPVNVILICCVGMVLEKLNKKDLALKQYQLATELQPSSPLALFKKAQLLYSLHHIEASLTEFEKLKTVAPDEASVHFLLGQLYKTVGRKTEAIKEFTIALNLDPKGAHLIKDVLETMND